MTGAPAPEQADASAPEEFDIGRQPEPPWPDDFSMPGGSIEPLPPDLPDEALMPPGPWVDPREHPEAFQGDAGANLLRCD